MVCDTIALRKTKINIFPHPFFVFIVENMYDAQIVQRKNGSNKAMGGVVFARPPLKHDRT